MPVVIDLSDEPSPKRAKHDASLGSTAAYLSGTEARGSKSGVEGLSNKELRQVIEAAGLSVAGIFEKTDLIQRAIEARTKKSCERMAWRLLRTRSIPPAGNSFGAVGFRELVSAGEDAPDFVVLSNFMIDATWLLDIWPELVSVTRVVVFHGEERIGGMQLPRHFELHRRIPRELFRWRGASWNPYTFGCHHSKFIMVAFRNRLKFAVTTANFIYSDVHDKSQGVWSQDFAKKHAGGTSEFEETLVDYVDSLLAHGGSATSGDWGGCCRGSLSDALRTFNYSDATAALVPSVPGVHEGDKATRYGHLRVRQLVRSEERKSGVVVMQFSSCASTNAKYRTDLLESFGGGGELKIVWPTVDDVRSSTAGYASGASLPSTLEHVNKLRSLFHRWSSKTSVSALVDARRHASPHIKTVTRILPNSVAWSVLTSHNVSQSSWGQIQKRGSQVQISHWELGVFVTPRSLGVESLVTSEQFERLNHEARSKVAVVPLPFPSSPAIRFTDLDRPWAAKRDRTHDFDYPDLPDRFGATSVTTACVRFYGCHAHHEERASSA